MTAKKAKCTKCNVNPVPKGTTVCHECAFMAEAEATHVLPEDMELCEHGLSAYLCGGPMHWYDHE